MLFQKTLEKMRKNEGGFTLIELLVVMIIIGILAAIAIPIFLNQKDNAADTAAKSDLRNAAIEVESFAVDANGVYPANQAAFDALPNEQSPNVGAIVYTLTDAGAAYTLAATSDSTTVFTYDSNAGGLQ